MTKHLIELFAAWTSYNGYSADSAEELLAEILTYECPDVSDIHWLETFIELWKLTCG